MLQFSDIKLPDLRQFDSYIKTVETMAVRITESFTVDTRYGQVFCEDGYLAVDVDGHPYPVAKELFENIYKLVVAGPMDPAFGPDSPDASAATASAGHGLPAPSDQRTEDVDAVYTGADQPGPGAPVETERERMNRVAEERAAVADEAAAKSGPDPCPKCKYNRYGVKTCRRRSKR